MLAVLRDRVTCCASQLIWPAGTMSACTPTCVSPPTRRTTVASTSGPRRWSTWSRSAGSDPTSGTRTRCIWTTPSIARMAATGTGAAHCPSSNARLGAGIARARDMRDAGIPVGLGVDGAASNESCSLWEELRHALLLARARGGPEALSVRDALDMATMGGARVLGRQMRSVRWRSGKLADIAVWRLDTLAHIDIADPVAALVLGGRPPLELLLVNGETVVEDDQLVSVDSEALASDVKRASSTLLSRATS